MDEATVEREATPQSFEWVLSSMCTEPHPEARRAAERFLASNPGDPATYGAVADLESEAVAALGRVAGLEDGHGYVASGGTEANIQAVRAARNLADTADPNVVAPESAHFSFRKAAAVLDVELRLADLEEYAADPAAVRDLADPETALVVAVAGSTEYGRVDPIGELCEVAADVDARVHVDAAWGGFVLPFTEYDWHFGDYPIDTLTVDPHKMGQAAIPAGGFLARERATLDALSVETPYLESGSQATMTGTRSGAGVASAAAAIESLWPAGYREAAERGRANAEWLADELAARGLSVIEPTLPLVAAELPAEQFRALREQGWRISRTEAGELRVVMMPHVTREMLERFLSDLDGVR
jgi:tyrosine decarboxylase/aspartate 1-decarboxylase